MAEGVSSRSPRSCTARLNELDDRAIAALDRERRGRARRDASTRWQARPVGGQPLPDDDLPSDVVIPPADLTLEETRRLSPRRADPGPARSQLRDPRIEAYARLLVERCIDPAAGLAGRRSRAATWRARYCVELLRLIAERGAYALPRITHHGVALVPRAGLGCRRRPRSSWKSPRRSTGRSGRTSDADIVVFAPENAQGRH